MKNILVLCTGNSCRSQMADGWLKFFAKGKANVYSAGIETHGVNPNAIKFMKEAGIDISNHTSNNVNEYLTIPFDFIITVCDHAKENCPYIPSDAQRFHHNFTDPSKVKGTEDEIALSFRFTRDEIKEYCKKFVEEFVQ
jgi:arsenate reductase (thioredoxin)